MKIPTPCRDFHYIKLGLVWLNIETPSDSMRSAVSPKMFKVQIT